MKKTFLTMMTITLCLCTFTFADDEDANNFYVKVLGGAHFLHADSNGGIQPSFSPGYIVGGSLGYQLCYGLNVEAEYAFRRNNMRKIHFFGQDFKNRGSFQSSSYMANLIGNLSICECFQPFLGLGIGYDVKQFHTREAGFEIVNDKKGFSWQLMVGINYPYFCNTDVALEYRFHKGPLHNFYSHALAVSVAYKFQCF